MGLSKNGRLPYHIGVFLEISHDATKELLKQNMKRKLLSQSMKLLSKI